MIKIFQTVVDKGHGNCMQAAIASLFEVRLTDVPNFIELGRKWYSEMHKYYSYHGYSLHELTNTDVGVTKKALEHDGGVNGFFYATVYSQTFQDGTTHAVIINKNMEIVHDPNPNQLSLELTPWNILQVSTVTPGWHISVDGEVVKRDS